MKPQCETTADCLEQLARVMREFGFTNMLDAIRSEYVHYYGERYDPGRVLYSPQFDNPAAWSFAIAKLEDKPVFLGSEVFHQKLGFVKAVQVMDGELFSINETTGSMFRYRTNEYSWTPPKQTVTLKVGGNEPVEVEKPSRCFFTNPRLWHVEFGFETLEAAEQFRKAMKPLVKE